MFLAGCCAGSVSIALHSVALRRDARVGAGPNTRRRGFEPSRQTTHRAAGVAVPVESTSTHGGPVPPGKA